MHKCGIYKITSPSGKIYIGQSSNIDWRWEQYQKYPSSYIGQTRLYNSIQKYGYDNHKLEIIELCSVEQLDEKEVYWGLHFDVLGTNGLVCRLGNGKGIISEITKKRMSDGIKGKKLGKKSIGSGRKKGFKMSDDHKQKIGKALFGKPSNHLGFKDSEETLLKKRLAKPKKIKQ